MKLPLPKKPLLYRKVNTRARGVWHHFGGQYKHRRHAKLPVSSMAKGVRRGLDYTPLFKFLLSKVGSPWVSVYREAASRLDSPEPIFWLVATHKAAANEYVRVGQSSYFSGLYVDENGLLQITATHIGPETLKPSCPCCTHTFNGVVFTQKYVGHE